MKPLTFRLLGLALACAAATVPAADRDGETVYQAECSTCHDANAPRTPTFTMLNGLETSRIVSSLETGAMRVIGNFNLSGPERVAVAEFHALAGAPPSDGSDLERVRRISEANREVHGVIVEAAHHERLATMLARTVDIPLVFRAFRSFNADELGRSDLFHGLIFEAIELGDPARASRLMVEHISQGLDVISGGLDADDATES